jgi:AcrR family transcriptional regulator
LYAVQVFVTVLNESPRVDWRTARRDAARATILAAAWDLVRTEGLAALSLRELARRAGITTPTVYSYFDSKNAIFDAMFGEGARAFAAIAVQPFESDDPRERLLACTKRFVDFCISDVPRYQLLFQHSVPGFSPSAESFEPAIRALDVVREQLALNGVHDERHVDLWTALTTGLVDQQISNDPGGERWSRLVDGATEMFLAHCATERTAT